MGFKNYCENKNNVNTGDRKNTQNDEENIKNIYNKYKDKSEGELMGELYNVVNKQKENGTFDLQSLQNSLQKISPLLSSEQNEKIKDILQKLN